MCGRIVLKAPAHQVAAEFAVEAPVDLAPRHNITPGQPVLAVRAGADGARTLAPLVWGLVVPWASGPRSGPPPINARSETVAERPTFRDAFRRRRCLVPVDGFYEWRREGKQRTPFYFSAPAGRLLALAGLWQPGHDPADHTTATCALLTTAASADMAPVHDRMPVILPAAWHDDWLRSPEHDLARLLAMLGPAPSGTLQRWPVSARVNRNTSEGPDLIRPVADDQPRQLGLF